MKRKENKLILIPSLILVILWIGFGIYHNLASSTISETLNVQISPISPTFDTKTIEDLKKRRQFVPQFTLPETSPAAISSPSSEVVEPSLQEDEQATDEASVSP